jgi:hypothetical protein
VVLNESYPELGNPSILPGQRVPLTASNLPIKSIPGGGRKKLHRIQAAELQSDGPDGVGSKANDTVDSGGKSHCVFSGCGEQRQSGSFAVSSVTRSFACTVFVSVSSASIN